MVRRKRDQRQVNKKVVSNAWTAVVYGFSYLAYDEKWADRRRTAEQNRADVLKALSEVPLSFLEF